VSEFDELIAVIIAERAKLGSLDELDRLAGSRQP